MIQRLWKKLFTKNNIADEAALHSAGAIVRHRNPFENLEVSRNENKISQEFIDKWVVPFYMFLPSIPDQKTINSFAAACKEIDLKITSELLRHFDWRTKITGAYFAAINDYRELEDIIGRNLLKSELCYAGCGYCLALATFNTSKSKDYLKQYLEYYLQRKDLWFDQAEAFCALEYIDKQTSKEYLDMWYSFIADKPNWDLNNSREHFKLSLETIQMINEQANQ